MGLTADLGNEIEYLWKRPKTQSTYWFFFTRYFMFFGSVTFTALSYMLSPQRSEFFDHSLSIVQRASSHPSAVVDNIPRFTS